MVNSTLVKTISMIEECQNELKKEKKEQMAAAEPNMWLATADGHDAGEISTSMPGFMDTT